MMDGGVASVRLALDQAGFSHVPILSYAVKYASALYGPFREAADGQMRFGDRRTYQMNPTNAHEALQEAQLDVAEGADMLMVKPAHAYLDVIYRVKQAFPGLPVLAYHTSGEYAMIQAGAQQGWIDAKAVTLEVMVGIKRAGADAIISYASLQIAQWLHEQD
jgi:porphobilinogen synthase